MRSYAFMLGAAVCLVSAAGFADENKYWEKRDVDPTSAAPSKKVDPAKPDVDPTSDAPTRKLSNKDWANRDVTPADEDQKPERNYYQSRDTNPGDPDDPKEVEDVLNKRAEATKGDRDHSMDRRDLKRADPDDKRLGVAFETGGGVGGFIDDDISGATSAQGQYTGRVVVGTRRHFAGEAAYVGSAQRVNTLGVSPNSMLYGNGVEGAFRFNVLTGMWQPYATGGLGWVHYNMNDSAVLTTSDVQASGDVITFPVGVGMAWRMNRLILDSRLSFHPATGSNMIRGANLSTWDLQAKAGFEL